MREKYFRFARGTDWKIQLLAFWEFYEKFVRCLYADLANMAFCPFLAFTESVS
jgi:hypothetical protein